jgi:hypothetical protein
MVLNMRKFICAIEIVVINKKKRKTHIHSFASVLRLKLTTQKYIHKNKQGKTETSILWVPKRRFRRLRRLRRLRRFRRLRRLDLYV